MNLNNINKDIDDHSCLAHHIFIGKGKCLWAFILYVFVNLKIWSETYWHIITLQKWEMYCHFECSKWYTYFVSQRKLLWKKYNFLQFLHLHIFCLQIWKAVYYKIATNLRRSAKVCPACRIPPWCTSPSLGGMPHPVLRLWLGWGMVLRLDSIRHGRLRGGGAKGHGEGAWGLRLVGGGFGYWGGAHHGWPSPLGAEGGPGWPSWLGAEWRPGWPSRLGRGQRTWCSYGWNKEKH